jgi:hypothetical protein
MSHSSRYRDVDDKQYAFASMEIKSSFHEMLWSTVTVTVKCGPIIACNGRQAVKWVNLNILHGFVCSTELEPELVPLWLGIMLLLLYIDQGRQEVPPLSLSSGYFRAGRLTSYGSVRLIPPPQTESESHEATADFAL